MAFTQLSDVLKIPPGGWRYRQAETGLSIRGGDYYNLCEKVRRHRQLNRLHCGPELDDQIQAQLCEEMSPEARAIYCRDNTLRPESATLRPIEFADVKHFLSTIASVRKFVSQTEANSRAEICASCPENKPIAGCTPCRNLVGLVFKIIGNRSTPLDSRLGACGVCGCSLAASVHIPLEAFPAEPRYDYPDWCWKRKS